LSDRSLPVSSTGCVSAGEANAVRVGLVLDGSEEYGVLTFVRYLLESLDRDVVTPVGVFLGDGPGRAMLLPLCDEVCDLHVGCILPLSRPGRPPWDPANLLRIMKTSYRAVRALTKAIRAERLDALHVHMFPVHVIAGLAARRCGCPCIWHWHGPLAARRMMGRLASYGLAHWATHIPCISRFVADTLPEVVQPKCRVVHNGVAAEAIRAGQRPGELRKRAGVGPDQPLIGLFGAFNPRKGHTYLLEAARLLRGRFPAAHYALVGHEMAVSRLRYGYGERLRQLTAELGLTDVVHFCGAIPEAWQYMGDCDIVCMPTVPSTHDLGEGFGLVMAEAMAAGVPVVATTCGAPPEVIEDGISGRLVPPRNAEALAAGIAELLADPARRAAMGAAAMRRIRAHFDVTQVARGMEAIYRDCRHGAADAGRAPAPAARAIR